MTVVFDACQNSEDNFAFLAGTAARHRVGARQRLPGPHRLPASARSVVDQERFGG